MKLYHYTSFDVLKKMLADSIYTDDKTSLSYLKLYATHISYLVDKSEFVLYTDKLKQEVITFASKQNYILSKSELEILDKLCYPNYYTTSLTDSCENTYMWETYGKNFSGICIEFDFSKTPIFYPRKDKAIGMCTAYASLLNKCQYLDRDDIIFQESEISRILGYIISQNLDSKDDIENVINGASIISWIQRNAISIKRKAFHKEQEIRYVVSGKYILSDISTEQGNHITYFPIPLSAVSSIILGSSINSQSIIDDITNMAKEKLDDSVTIVLSKCKPV